MYYTTLLFISAVIVGYVAFHMIRRSVIERRAVEADLALMDASIKACWDTKARRHREEIEAMLARAHAASEPADPQSVAGPAMGHLQDDEGPAARAPSNASSALHLQQEGDFVSNALSEIEGELMHLWNEAPTDPEAAIISKLHELGSWVSRVETANPWNDITFNDEGQGDIDLDQVKDDVMVTLAMMEELWERLQNRHGTPPTKLQVKGYIADSLGMLKRSHKILSH